MESAKGSKKKKERKKGRRRSTAVCLPDIISVLPSLLPRLPNLHMDPSSVLRSPLRLPSSQLTQSLSVINQPLAPFFLLFFLDHRKGSTSTILPQGSIPPVQTHRSSPPPDRQVASISPPCRQLRSSRDANPPTKDLAQACRSLIFRNFALSVTSQSSPKLDLRPLFHSIFRSQRSNPHAPTRTPPKRTENAPRND